MVTKCLSRQGCTQENGAVGLQPPPTTTTTNRNLKKNTDFVVTMISNLLSDLPFSQNQQMKSADD